MTPLSRTELLQLIGHFAGSPYRDRLEQIAAHDEAQRAVINEQARQIAYLSAPSQAYLDEMDEPERPAPVLSPEVREAAERVKAVILRGAETGERNPDSPLGAEGAEALIAILSALDAAPAPEPSTHAMLKCEVR